MTEEEAKLCPLRRAYCTSLCNFYNEKALKNCELYDLLHSLLTTFQDICEVLRK